MTKRGNGEPGEDHDDDAGEQGSAWIARPCGCVPEVTRREFLRLSMGAAAGLMLGRRANAAASPAPPAAARADRMILLYLNGGPSHLDTFDPKPGTPGAGRFRAIDTSIPGVKFSEHLPGLAERARHLAVIRSLNSREGSHGRARYLMHTAYPPVPGTRHPSIGSSLSHEVGDRSSELPGYVALGGPGEGSGFFGPDFAPFVINGPAGQKVDNLEPFHDVDAGRLDSRIALMAMYDEDFKKRGATREVEAHQAMITRARQLMKSSKVPSFVLGDGDQADLTRYGESEFGKRCLVARKLIESGVGCVEVELNGWDTHQDNFTEHQRLMGELDPAASALLDDLVARQLLDRTLVVCVGEFGRSPRINGREGRDHHPRCFSAFLAGGPLRRGVVVGASDADGDKIADRPVSVPDLFTTVLGVLGVDPERDFQAGDRPIALGNGGKKIGEIL